MRKLFAMLLAMMSLSLMAAEKDQPGQYVDALSLRIINQGWTPDQLDRDYSRLPAYLRDSLRTELWDLSQCSAGIAVRFATDSKRVGVKYRLLRNFHMIHMADTGTKGMDLYIWDDKFDRLDSVGAYQPQGYWMNVKCIRPYVNNDSDKVVEQNFVENLDGKMHEFMMYLPLYDGVEQLWVKVDSGATITPGSMELIVPEKRIVTYGTSIMQGGCASRPGMAYTNIFSRQLNREVINIGHSGQGKMDYEMARAIAQIPDVDLFILDPVPNCTAAMCDSLTYDFVNIIRKARPEAKIIMVEGPMYPYSRYDSYFRDYLPLKNANFRRNYELLKAEDPRNLYYVDSIELDGAEDDGTVDGVHLTDLGFLHYAQKLMPTIIQVLNE